MRNKIYLLSVLLLASNYVIASQCNPEILPSESLAVITVSEKGTIDNFQDSITCAAQIVKERYSIERIRIDFKAGVYRQINNVSWPDNLKKWSGDLEIVSKENANLSGAVQLQNFIKLNDNLYSIKLPSNVYQLLKDFWQHEHGLRTAISPPELIVDDDIYQIARSPNSGFYNIEKVNNDEDNSFFAKETLPNVDLGGNVFAQGFFFNDWADSLVKVSSFNNEYNAVKLERSPKYGIKEGGRFILLNSPSFIDEPKEYALDDSGGILAYIDHEPRKIEISYAENIIFASNLNKLTLRGLSFSGVRGSAIKIKGDNILLENSSIKNVGWAGIEINGSNNTIDSTNIDNVGYSSIVISGGDRQTLTPSNNKISKNRLTNFGRLMWSSVPSVRVDGVGAIVDNNIIKEGPHAGIFYFGNNHIISNNDISYVAKLTGDVGAIYTGRDWSGQGNQVLDNYIHDVLGNGFHGATAIYIDDQSSGITVKNNIIWNVYRGILIGGGRDNYVEHNIIAKAKICLRLDARGLDWQSATVTGNGIMVQKLNQVPYNQGAYLTQYPSLSKVLIDRTGAPTDNFVINNIGYCPWVVDDVAIEVGHSVIKDNISNGNPGFKNFDLLFQETLPARFDFDIDWQSVFPETVSQ